MNSYYTLFQLSQCRAILTFTVCMLANIAAHAHNKAVVIPMSGDDLKPLANIITVAKENGDFSNPVAALTAITDASEEKPYLIVIAPGLYQITPQLVMKPFVDIAGSGRGVTTLFGSAGSNGLDISSALVVGANNSRLQNLSISNNDRGSDYASGIFNISASPTISNVQITLAGGAARYGVANITSSSATISSVTIEQYSSTLQIGVHNNNSIVTINDMTISQAGSGGLLVGIFNASGGISIADSVHFETSGSFSDRYGIFNSGVGAFAKIRNSTLGGSVSAGSGSGSVETYISNTILLGPVTGDPVCSFSFLSNGIELDNACLDI